MRLRRCVGASAAGGGEDSGASGAVVAFVVRSGTAGVSLKPSFSSDAGPARRCGQGCRRGGRQRSPSDLSRAQERSVSHRARLRHRRPVQSAAPLLRLCPRCRPWHRAFSAGSTPGEKRDTDAAEGAGAAAGATPADAAEAAGVAAAGAAMADATEAAGQMASAAAEAAGSASSAEDLSDYHALLPKLVRSLHCPAVAVCHRHFVCSWPALQPVGHLR